MLHRSSRKADFTAAFTNREKFVRIVQKVILNN